MKQAQLVLDQPENAIKFLEEMNQTGKDELIFTRRSWYLSLWGTITPAIIAIILLIGNFIVYLAAQL